MTLSYETLMLLLALAFLLGTLARPIRSAWRVHKRIQRARKAAATLPSRKRKRRRTKTTGIY